MTAKEKADELVKKMYAVHSNSASDITLSFSKECALITIDEMLKVGYYSDDKIYDYLHEVKQEIEKL
jgi:hypothetical protein